MPLPRRPPSLLWPKRLPLPSGGLSRPSLVAFRDEAGVDVQWVGTEAKGGEKVTASTHVAFSAVCSFLAAAVANTPPRFEDLAATGFASLLPDIDLPTSGIGRPFFPIAQWINKVIGHRTFTHSFLGILFFGLLASPFYLLGSKALYLALLLGYASHVVIDQQNVMGVELFWPSRLRAVLFLNERYRITVAGKGEYVLLCTLIGLMLLLYPVAAVGLKRSLHFVLGDVQSAVHDFRAFEERYDVEAVVSGAVDVLSGQKVSGVFEVIGAPSNTALLLQQAGQPRLLSEGETAHLKPHRVWVRPKAPHVVTIHKIPMAGRAFGDLEPLVRGRRAYLFGELQVADPAPFALAFLSGPARFPTVRRHEGRIILEYATFDELTRGHLLDLPIAEGEVLVKYIDATPQPIQEPGRWTGRVMAMTFRVKTLDAIQVKVGDRVAKGALLALRADDTELQSLLADLQVKKEQGAAEAAVRRLALQEAEGDLQNAHEELARARQELARYERGGRAFFPKQLQAAKTKVEDVQQKVQELTLKRERLLQEAAIAARVHRQALRHLEERMAKTRKELEVRAAVSGEVLALRHELQDQSIKVHLTVKAADETQEARHEVGGTGTMP